MRDQVLQPYLSIANLFSKLLAGNLKAQMAPKVVPNTCQNIIIPNAQSEYNSGEIKHVMGNTSILKS